MVAYNVEFENVGALARFYRKSFESVLDEIRRKDEGIETVHALDFSEIYLYLHFGVDPVVKEKFSRLNKYLFEDTENTFGIFPPMIAEFLWHIYNVSKIVEKYKKYEDLIEERSVQKLIEIVLDSRKKKYITDRMMKEIAGNEIALILGLMEEKGYKAIFGGPVETFLKFSKQSNVKSIYYYTNTIKEFFIPEDEEYYNRVLSELEKVPIRRDKNVNNAIDASLAELAYSGNDKYYEDIGVFFSVCTSSKYPLDILYRNNFSLTRPELKNLSIAGPPVNLLTLELCRNNFTSREEISNYLESSSKIFGLIEQTGNLAALYEEFEKSTKKITDKAIEKEEKELYNLYIFLKIFYFSDRVFLNRRWRSAYFDFLDQTNYARVSRLTLEEKVERSSSSSQDRAELKPLFVNTELVLQDDEYDRKAEELHRELKELVKFLYENTYQFLREYDPYKIAPQMIEMREKVLDGDY